jgi:enamine deaminase RidA (YjgF/YER057c/UK114 family)
MLDKYLIFLPEPGLSVGDELRQCLKQISNTSLPGKRLIKLNIFTDIPDYNNYLRESPDIRNAVKSHFGDQCPAFNITVHPPEKPLRVAVEAGYMNTDQYDIINREWNSIPYVVALSESGKEVWAGGLGSGAYPDDTRNAASLAFTQMKSLLSAEEMSFDNIVRQWNYIGNILEVKNGNQNYQVFNEVRSENYHKFRTIPRFPAATGVGMKQNGVLLDFFAVKPDGSMKIRAIDNPDQIRPYEYGRQVLKGVQPPQFERAVLIGGINTSTLFVSGTASIIGQDTIGIDDIERQTHVTIENISRLTDSVKKSFLSGNIVADYESMKLIRVYVKKQSDFIRVKEICSRIYPGVPAIYIEADICRDNLLVEIEAESSNNSLTITN